MKRECEQRLTHSKRLTQHTRKQELQRISETLSEAEQLEPCCPSDGSVRLEAEAVEAGDSVQAQAAQEGGQRREG